jgi:GT2 family glycosyltransferase
MSDRLAADVIRSVNLPAPGFNQYNVPVLQAPSSSIQPDLERIIVQKFAPRRLLLLNAAHARPFSETGLRPVVCASVAELESVLGQNGRAEEFDLAIWFYPGDLNENAERIIQELAGLAGDILLLPAPGALVSRCRPVLVEGFGRYDFLPDYECDLRELHAGAIRLTRRPIASVQALVPAVESAVARLTGEVHGLERTLRTRMTELEDADRHIAELEEKVLKLKEAKREIKQLKQEKHTLRKSPERKVGQVLLAPYRLPQRLFREVRKQIRPPSQLKQPSTAAAEYQEWLNRHRVSASEAAEFRENAHKFSHQPLISIITPVFNTPISWLEEAIQSVIDQVYEKWELLLIDDGSSDPKLLQALPTLAARDPRIKLASLPHQGICAASNYGLAQASGEWIGLLDHDDVLEPDALFQTAKLLQQHSAADLLYSDEDKLTDEGPAAPLFKPDWSPDFFLSYNYIGHFTTIRRELVQELGGFRPEFESAQDYDLYLRVVERTQNIHHIARVLYHWRRTAHSVADDIRRKPKVLEAARLALDAHLKRRGERGHTTVDWRTHAFRTKRDLIEEKKISIIVAANSSSDLLTHCLESLASKTAYQNCEIIIVENDHQALKTAGDLPDFKHRRLHYDEPSNLSALNNFAVAQTESPWLLFLGGGVEVIENDWLTIMAEHVQRAEVGAVGARLLFPDDTIEQAGMVLGVGEIVAPAFRGLPAEHPGVNRQLQVTRNCSAVSGACLLTRRDVFTQVGGFDAERLPAAYYDVDLCLKMRRAGYLIVYTPFAKLYRHEQASHGASGDGTEAAVMRERWPVWLERDPYYNPNLSRTRADFSLGN